MIFGGLKPTFLKPRWWNFAGGCGPGGPGPGTSSHRDNFVKIVQGDSFRRGQIFLTKKFEIFVILCYLAHIAIPIMLKVGWRERMGDIRNPSATQNFVRIAQGILHISCRYCIASEVMHFDFWLIYHFTHTQSTRCCGLIFFSLSHLAVFGRHRWSS